MWSKNWQKWNEKQTNPGAGDFDNLLSTSDETIRQKISKDTEELNNSNNQQDLTDIYVTLHPTIAKHILFFKCPWDIYKIDSILDHKTNLNKFETIEIIQNVFSEHNEIKPEIKKQKENGKISKHLQTKWYMSIIHGSKRNSQGKFKKIH